MRRLALLVAVLAVPVAATPAVAAPKAARACDDGKLLDASGSASLVRFDGDLYGCRRDPEQGWRLTRERGWHDPALNAAKAAYAGASSVAVVDLRRGRGCTAVTTAAPVRMLALTRWGALAYVTGAGTAFEVRVVDAAGDRALAAGEDVDPDSLYLQGTTVQWEQGGAGRSAELERTRVPCRTRLR